MAVPWEAGERITFPFIPYAVRFQKEKAIYPRLQEVKKNDQSLSSLTFLADTVHGLLSFKLS
jgi:hypothetical protein